MFAVKGFDSTTIIKYLALLYIFHLPNVNAKVVFVEKYREFPGKNVKFNDHSIENENVVFAVCEGQKEEKNCTVVHQNYPYDNISRSCNLTASIDKEIAQMPFVFMDVRPLGKDKALLIWEIQGKNSSTNDVQITTLNMHDCKTSEFILREPSGGRLYWSLYWYDIIVRHNDSYDMFVKSENIYNNDIRQLRVDSQTGSIEELNSHLNNKPIEIFAVATESPAKGYVYRELHNNTIYRYWLLKPDGFHKLLESRSSTHIFSSGNDAIGICGRYGNSSSIQCTQYDEDGNIKSTTELEESVARAVAMYMTPHGGFLLLLSDFPRDHYVNHRVIRVNTNGEIVGHLRLEEFDNLREFLIAPHIYDRGNGNYCISLLSSGREARNEAEERDDLLNIAAYCFSEADLF